MNWRIRLAGLFLVMAKVTGRLVWAGIGTYDWCIAQAQSNLNSARRFL